MSKGIAGRFNRDWKFAFIGAFGIHLALAILSIIGPNLWEKSRPMPPVYTVKIFETVDLPSPNKAEPKKQAPSVKPKPKIKKIKKEEAKVAPLQKISKPKQQKAVSLRPRKPEAKPVATRDAEKLLSKRLKNIEESVNEKKSEALIKNRLSAIRSSVETRTKKSITSADGTGAGSGQQNEVLRLYKAEIWARVRSQWVLPEQLLDKTGLASVVVVRIAQDGSVLKAEYEHKSGHALLDQSAMRAVQKASPFSQLPRALRPGPLEIVFTFRPGEAGS